MINLTLQSQEVQLIINGLTELPFKKVTDLIHMIQESSNRQLREQEEEEKKEMFKSYIKNTKEKHEKEESEAIKPQSP